MDHCHGAAKPAYETKHVPLLKLRGHSDAIFYLNQCDDNGVDNGTTLWLAGQVLAMALPGLLSKRTKKRAIELGSGIGYTALALASMGWDVVATDTQNVIRSVLQKNIDSNKSNLQGSIQVRELDWTTTEWDPDSWSGFDLILTADTLYDSYLVRPLLRTIHLLALCNPLASIFVAIERRDGALLDDAFEGARSEFGFEVQRIPDKKLAKAVQKAGCQWRKMDWSGVELWKLGLQANRQLVPQKKT